MAPCLDFWLSVTFAATHGPPEIQLSGNSLSYLRPLKVHSVHERALKVLDSGVLTLQQTLKLQVRFSPKISQ